MDTERAETRARLISVAGLVRRALEHPTLTFQGFPAGYCQGASKILARYLVEVEGLRPIVAVANGSRYLPRPGDPDWPIEQSHFWLEHAGFIIDITADQFEDGMEPVVVTADRTWHDQFVGQTRLTEEVTLNLNDYLSDRYNRLLRFLRVSALPLS